jgi:polysaccharide deacetylase 2 family uncharacterized protein YibQ
VPWLALGLLFGIAAYVGWYVAGGGARTRTVSTHHHRASGVAAPVPAAPDASAASPMPTPAAAVVTPAAAVVTPAAAATAGAGRPRLAIIIDDCGQWIDTERALIALPIPLTVSILPGVRYTSTIEHEASQAGKGIMMHLPMEASSQLDPGPGKVTTAMDDAAIEAQVRKDLDAVPLARGVNNHEGSRATADARVMHDVAQVLSEEGRYFIDSRTTAETQAAHETEALGVPTASRNVFLDDVVTVAAIEAQLEQAAHIALSSGSAIAIGHPKPETLEALRKLIPKVEAEGVDFVLAQDLVSGG